MGKALPTHAAKVMKPTDSFRLRGEQRTMSCSTTFQRQSVFKAAKIFASLGWATASANFPMGTR